jgi:hypothetical protein
MTDQTNLDRLIDDVARDITAHEPPAYLRARVLARLDERRSPRRAWLLIPVAASAAAVLVTIIVINGNRQPHLPEATALAPSTAIAPTTPDRVAIVAADQSSHGGPATITVAERHDVPNSDAAAWRETLMPSLPALAALGIATIQPDTLAIPQLTMKPLVVAPIDDNNNQR